ncbi:MAG: T9SS type A sorting domain-containing protein [Bacteroidia bacterium]|nr:T9SS type A sorting domain-containing protein [Bacteroidia bacterium]
MKQRLRQKMQYRTHIVVGSIVLVLSGLFSTFFMLSDSEEALAAASGDFRSKQSGNWNTKTNWEKYNGSAWVTASAAPKESDGTVNILSGHTITVSSSVTINQLYVDSGATLINNNGNFKISNATGTDITVNGTLTLNAKITLNSSTAMAVYGTVNKTAGEFKINSGCTVNIYNGGLFKHSGGTLDDGTSCWTFNAGSTFQHNINGGTIVNGTWNITSTCLITGSTSTLPENLHQSFGNITFNTASLTGDRDFTNTPDNVQGDFRIISTGTGTASFNQASNDPINIGGDLIMEGGTVYMTETGNCPINIGGDLTISGGTLSFMISGSSTSGGNVPCTVDGDLIMNGGVIDMSRYTGSTTSKGIGTFNLEGDLVINAGEIKETSTSIGEGTINFTGNSTQLFVNNGTISNTINFEVQNGATVDAGVAVFTGSGTFSVEGGASIVIGSADGITSSGATGNVQVTGARTYSGSASYRYGGTVAQVTGNGLPETVANIAFDNSAGVTLTNNVSTGGSVILENGIVSTGSNSLTVGTSILSTGSISRTNGWVDGNLTRWIPLLAVGSFIFPVGVSDYNEFVATYTVLPSLPGRLTVRFVESSPLSSGLPLLESNSYKVNTIGSKGYWDLSTAGGLSGGIYTISVLGTGFSGISELSEARLLTRPSSVTSWELLGDHSPGTGSLLSPVVSRLGIGLPQQITIGWGYNALPIELMSFAAKVEGKTVRLYWSTAAEINNDYFTLERSEDGRDWEAIGTLRGSGNTTTQRDYTFVDEDPLNGESYYRLRQTDYDGKYEIFDPEHVLIKKTVLDDSKITVWPNPFEEKFDLEIESEESGTLTITLLAIDGRTLRNEVVSIDAPGMKWSFQEGGDLLPGTYILRLQVNDEVISKKLVRK